MKKGDIVSAVFNDDPDRPDEVKQMLVTEVDGDLVTCRRANRNGHQYTITLPASDLTMVAEV